MRHQWIKIISTDSYGIPHQGERCSQCGTRRETIAIVGVQRHRNLRSYVTQDGIRYTGQAPECIEVKNTPRRGRRPVVPLFTGPIPDNPEYRRLVNGILQEKRKREVIADILASKQSA